MKTDGRVDKLQGFVYVRSIRGFFALAAALRADPAAIARAAGCDLESLSVADTVISLPQYYALTEQFLLHTDNPDFGLLSGRISHMESAHLNLYLASLSRSLREWLNLLPSVASVFGDVGRTQLVRQSHYFKLEWRPRSAPDPVRCIITDSVLSASVLQMDSFCVLPVRPLRVDLTYDRPANLDELRAGLGASLYFNQPVSALHYDRKVLDFPQMHVTTRIYDAVAKEFAEVFSEDASVNDSFSLLLHAAIRRQLPAGECSVESIAAEINMSQRTMQRRLKERGTNFQQMLQSIKSKLAQKYLEDERLSVVETAYLLGYGDPSSFSAAFKS